MRIDDKAVDGLGYLRVLYPNSLKLWVAALKAMTVTMDQIVIEPKTTSEMSTTTPSATRFLVGKHVASYLAVRPWNYVGLSQWFTSTIPNSTPESSCLHYLPQIWQFWGVCSISKHTHIEAASSGLAFLRTQTLKSPLLATFPFKHTARESRIDGTVPLVDLARESGTGGQCLNNDANDWRLSGNKALGFHSDILRCQENRLICGTWRS